MSNEDEVEVVDSFDDDEEVVYEGYEDDEQQLDIYQSYSNQTLTSGNSEANEEVSNSQQPQSFQGSQSSGDILDNPLGQDEYVPNALQDILEGYRVNFENIINSNTNQPSYRDKLLSVASTYNYLIKSVFPNKINNQSSIAVETFIGSNNQFY